MADTTTGAASATDPGFLGIGDPPAQPAYDPNNPATWSGDQRTNFLGSLGLQWVSGNGDNAVWQTPDGKRYAESALFDQAFGTYDASGKQTRPPVGIDTTPTQPKAAAPPTLRYDATGQAYEWDGTTWQPNSTFNDPTKAAGYKAPTAGPAPKTALDIQQQQATIDATNQTIASAQATIARNAQLDALAAQQQTFLQQKANLAQQNDDQRLANETAAQIATIQNQRDIYAFNVTQAQQNTYQAQQQANAAAAQFNASGQTSAEEFNSTGAQNAAQFNAQQALATQQANNQAAAQKRTDLANVNAQVGQLAQDTGNRGLFATFATANSGFGKANTAIGQGQSLIDNTSAGPLETQLGTRNDIMAQPDNPYTFTPTAFQPVTFNPVPGVNLSNGPLSTFTPPSTGNQAPLPQMPPTASGVNDPKTGLPLTSSQVSSDNAATRAAAAALGIPAMAKGGMVRGAYMSGDSPDGKENAEINIPLGRGGAMVVSTRGMKPAQIKALKAKMQKFATGGLFDQLTDSPLSQQFLTDSSQQFRAGTPWAGQSGPLPSPVYQSSPGFNPDLAALLNSGRALEQGIPTTTSAFLADRYSPSGLSTRLGEKYLTSRTQ